MLLHSQVMFPVMRPQGKSVLAFTAAVALFRAVGVGSVAVLRKRF